MNFKKIIINFLLFFSGVVGTGALIRMKLDSIPLGQDGEYNVNFFNIPIYYSRVINNDEVFSATESFLIGFWLFPILGGLVLVLLANIIGKIFKKLIKVDEII